MTPALVLLALSVLAVVWVARFVLGFYHGFCEGVVRVIAGELAAAIRRAK